MHIANLGDLASDGGPERCAVQIPDFYGHVGAAADQTVALQMKTTHLFLNIHL
jgi:hypothetical protein